MPYTVKEIFYTLQGEGAQSGRAAVFCRFAGCNLWSGREQDRAASVCFFCDTDFVGSDGPGGGKFADAESLAARIAETWQGRVGSGRPLVVCTGGEPLLQLDAELLAALHRRGFQVAVESNGSCPAPDGIDWLCVSPKAGVALRLTQGDELKLVYPQPGLDPADFAELDFAAFFLQPMDGPERQQNTRLAVDYCLRQPRWRLCLQSHKLIGIP